MTWLLKTHSYTELVELQCLDEIRTEELQKAEGRGQKAKTKWPEWKDLKTKMHILLHGKELKKRKTKKNKK